MAFDSEVTTKSRDLIVLERARQKAGQDWGKGHCVGTCIWWSEGGDALTCDETARLLGFTGAGEMFRWNDALGRTKEEALARFDTAIATLTGER